MKRLLALIVSLAMVLSFASCTPVTSEKTNPESIEITFTETSLAPGSYTLTAKVLPENASQDATYSLIGTVPGVSLDGATLTVSENAVDGTAFRVKASVKTDPTISDTVDLTVNNPAPEATVITTEEELRAMELNGSYQLGNDITLTSAWTPLGTPDNTDENIAGVGFSGTLNGNGYTIKNLNIAGTWNAGFFAQIDATGIVKNIGFESEEGAGKGVTGNAWCGVVAGINHGLIENCYTNVQVKMNGCPGGAFVGSNVGEYAIINNSYAIGTVTVGEGAHGASFSGSNDGGQINNSYFLETAGNCAIGWNTTADAKIQKSRTWMTTANNYVEAGWNATVWALVDGYFPMLRYEGFEAPAPVAPDPELSVTNEERYLDYNVEGQRTLQITYSISNVTDNTVTFALEAPVAGVSISAEGVVTLSDDVVDGATFTVVVTSNEVATLNATKTFTVNRVAVSAEAVEITTFAQLVALTTTANPADMAKNYRLEKDIDASTAWFNTPIGAGAGVPFTGTFDGNGYSIVGIAGGNEGYDYGLFKEIGVGGIVKNLGIEIREEGNLCANRMGAVASVNKGTISNVIITGEIWCTDVNAGGVVWDNHGVIENVVMLAFVNNYYNKANAVGAITYHQQEGAVIRNCYVDSEATGLTSVTRLANADLDGACMSTEAMKSAATFSALDSSVWNIVDGAYPTLKKGVDTVFISNLNDLVALTTTTNPADMAKKYRLANDIDASTAYFNTPIGAGAGVPFTGTFDGNGYSIVGIAGGNEGYDYGLFKEIGVGGIVKNLGIEIREEGNLCANRMGAVASVNKGTISNVIITGEIWCTDVNAGGVVWDNHGVIENVVMLAFVNNYYNKANAVGAITYHQQEGAVIRNCYVDSEATGLTSVTRLANADLDGACMSTEAMKSAATFSALDTSVWNIVDGAYPTLIKGIL